MSRPRHKRQRGGSILVAAEVENKCIAQKAAGTLQRRIVVVGGAGMYLDIDCYSDTFIKL